MLTNHLSRGWPGLGAGCDPTTTAAGGLHHRARARARGVRCGVGSSRTAAPAGGSVRPAPRHRDAAPRPGLRLQDPSRARRARPHRARHPEASHQAPTRPPHRLTLGLRWIVEATNSWWSNYGQLHRSTDRRTRRRHAALCLATVVLIVGQLIDHATAGEPENRRLSAQALKGTSTRSSTMFHSLVLTLSGVHFGYACCMANHARGER